jgi:hypothetical protein
MAHKITLTYTRPIQPGVDISPEDSPLCASKSCPNYATQVCLWRTRKHPYRTWSSKLLCDKHTKLWIAHHADTYLRDPADIVRP